MVKKFNIVLIALFIISAFGLKIWQYHWSTASVLLNGQSLHVLVAKTPYQQNRGLGQRDSLGKFDGMLFIFPLPKKQGIVMRDMRFPIDIVWLKDGIVVDIAANVPIEPNVADADLKVYYPRLEANQVLELPAGWAEKNGVKIGDEIFTENE